MKLTAILSAVVMVPTACLAYTIALLAPDVTLSKRGTSIADLLPLLKAHIQTQLPDERLNELTTTIISLKGHYTRVIRYNGETLYVPLRTARFVKPDLEAWRRARWAGLDGDSRVHGSDSKKLKTD